MANTLTPCSAPRCGALIPLGAGRCAAHARGRRTHRLTTAQRGYGWAWRRVSEQYRRDHPVCEICGRRWATEVDHKRPISDGGARLDRANLKAVCRPCHVVKTREQQRGRA